MSLYNDRTLEWIFFWEFSWEQMWTTATVLPLINLLFSTKSTFSAIISQTFCTVSITVLFVQEFLLLGTVSYQDNNAFFKLLCMWVELWRKLVRPLWNEINSRNNVILEPKNCDSKSGYFVIESWTTLCVKFWYMFSLGKTLIISDYL